MTQSFVILGACGDLTGRYLMPALYRLERAAALPADLQVLAIDRADGDDASYREGVRARVVRHVPDVDEPTARRLLERVRYRTADVTSTTQLGEALHGAGRPVALYLALPNTVFLAAVEALTALDLPARTRLVAEKPFGASLQDARTLNTVLRRRFGEADIFRVDHFLAKQTVLNVLGLRFANRVFEPVWGGLHVAGVDIVWDETLGLEGRAGYYDRAGALRDMVQNHLLQLLAVVAMEPPTSLDERDLRDRKADVLRAVRPPGPEEMRTATRRARYTAGQVEGRSLPAYVDEKGVNPERGTETFAEVTVHVENWRWAGVPFRLRTGKALGRGRREIALHFRPTPHQPFAQPAPTDVLRLSLDPDRIGLEVNLNGAGDPFELERETLAASFPAQDLPPYSLLVREILDGDPTLSIRGDEAEEGWRIVEPVLAAWAAGQVPLEEYPAGSAGPA